MNTSINNNSYTCTTSFVFIRNMSNSQREFLITINLLIMVVVVLVNTAVVYLLVKTKQLLNTSIQLIFYLTIVDCLVGIIIPPLFAISLFNYPYKRHCSFNITVQFVSVFLTHASGYIIGLIGVDRYYRMKYLNRYSEFVTTRKLHISLALVLSLSFIVALVYTLGSKLQFFLTVRYIVSSIDSCIVLLVFSTYILTATSVTRYRQASTHQNMLRNVDKGMTSIASKILIAILIFYTPYVCISIIHTKMIKEIYGKKRQWLNFALFFSYSLVTCNSFANGIIFIKFNKKSRKEFIRLCVIKVARNILVRRVES